MSQETILVIDDNRRFARSLINYMIQPFNYKAFHATNGAIGLELALAHKPDLILLDMNMPGMTGLEVLAALRKTNCIAPVIFMTAEGSETIAVKAFRLGVRDYLTKPFSADELQQSVDVALHETRLVREKEQLERDLLVSETVRQTVVTLAHYLNNYLSVLRGNLFLALEDLPAYLPDDSDILDALGDSDHSVAKIETVLRVLRQITEVKLTTYHGKVKMLDIEAALEKELAKLEQRRQQSQTGRSS